jgi:hypothetical protein
VIARAIRDRRAAEHPRQFLGSFRLVERLEPRARRAAAHLLRDPQLMVRLGGDLRQVGDAQHLAVRRECAQLSPDHFRDRAADAGVDLVEDEAGEVCRRDGRDLQREADA